MRVKLENRSPEERAVVQVFKTDVTSVFNDLYEDKWDQERWERTVGKLSPVHPYPLDDQQTRRVDMKCVGPKFCAVDGDFEITSIDVRILCARLNADSLSNPVVMLTWRRRCDVDQFTRVHDARILMKAINSKYKDPEEFWENLREGFIKGPPVFVR